MAQEKSQIDQATIEEAKLQFALLKEFAKSADPDFRGKAPYSDLTLSEGSAFEDKTVYVLRIVEQQGGQRIVLSSLYGNMERYHPDFKKFVDQQGHAIKSTLSDYLIS
ncbi:MAG: hypothetical protein KDJ35_03785 [Alphaproteobacteria bacterium]|nr:hypothetical protein [Alphaproteobacteria bacterium]